MRLADPAWRLARETFGRYRMRAIVGLSGVVCGVAVALAAAAVNEGARRVAMADVARLGANTLVIRATAPGHLDVRDVPAVTELVPFVAAAAPIQRVDVTLSGPRGTLPAILLATTASYSGLVDITVAHGRFLRADESNRGTRVCVLGHLVARAAFAYDDPIGGSVRVGDAWYRVIGVAGPGPLDRSVVVPLAARAGHGLSIDPELRFDELWLSVEHGRFGSVAADARRLLARRHVTRESAYEVTIPSQVLAHRTSTERLFNEMSAATAALLLVLGGLGIMNSMLTSVVERTREIGLRRAVGATRTDILRQFMAEAALLASAGGAAGVAAGVLLSIAVARAARWPVAISAADAAAVMLLAAGVGVVSGIYPARRAAAAAPIDVVMHE
jgi:putative ABC transport system permease protein